MHTRPYYKGLYMSIFLKKRLFRARRRLLDALDAAPPRVVFLHIPKCAGSTINLHFKVNIGSGKGNCVATVTSVMVGAHSDTIIKEAQEASYVTGHYGFDFFEMVNKGAFSFVFFRDPLDRLLSLYHFCRSKSQDTGPTKPLFEQAKRLNLAEFCLSQNPKIRSFVDNAQARTLAFDYPLKENSDYNKTAILEQALENLKQFDYVGLAETANDDLEAIAKFTNTIILKKNLKANITKPTGYKDQQYDLDELAVQLAPVLDIDMALYKEARRVNQGQKTVG